MGNHSIFTEVAAPYWDDRDVYIVGGGPSLKGFDFNRLAGKFTVGCNDAAFHAQTDVLFTIDHNYAVRRAQEARSFAESGGEVCFAVPANFKPEKTQPGINYLRRMRHGGLSDDPREVYGLNSGYGALNLAYLKKARRVFLLGYDMRGGCYETGGLPDVAKVISLPDHVWTWPDQRRFEVYEDGTMLEVQFCVDLAASTG